MRPVWHVGAAAAIAASALLIAGCGSTSSASGDAEISARKAAAPVMSECPDTAYEAAHLRVRNTTDIPLKINSSGDDICRFFSGHTNPTLYNGTSSQPGKTLDMVVFMRGSSAVWKMSILPIPAPDNGPHLHSPMIHLSRSPGGAEQFESTSGLTNRFKIGPMRTKTGGLRDVVAEGGPGETMTLAYSAG